MTSEYLLVKTVGQDSAQRLARLKEQIIQKGRDDYYVSRDGASNSTYREAQWLKYIEWRASPQQELPIEINPSIEPALVEISESHNFIRRLKEGRITEQREPTQNEITYTLDYFSAIYQLITDKFLAEKYLIKTCTDSNSADATTLSSGFLIERFSGMVVVTRTIYLPRGPKVTIVGAVLHGSEKILRVKLSYDDIQEVFTHQSTMYKPLGIPNFNMVLDQSGSSRSHKQSLMRHIMCYPPRESVIGDQTFTAVNVAAKAAAIYLKSSIFD